jgi:S1-C subfamily serine protease
MFFIWQCSNLSSAEEKCMNNRRTVSLIAAIGCGALLLLIALPLAAVLWLFSGGVIHFPTARNTQPISPPVVQQTSILQPTATPKSNSPIPQTGGPDVNQVPSAAQSPGSLAELYKKVSPGTVSILVEVNSGGQTGAGAGSGFILTKDGFIATNDHVVEGGDQFIVRFFNDVDVQATVVGKDPDSDLAVLKVDQLPEGAYPLALGDSNKIQVGDYVVAIGNPFALGTSMSYGIISALGRTIPSITQFNIPQAIQTDAAINPGNSGGPLINMNGEVIGVNAQIQTSSQGGGSVGIGFAIPANILKQVYPSLIQNGSYQWPYLGVSSAEETPGFQKPGSPANNQRGALIADVVPNGPAAKAGIQSGDIITKAGDSDIRNFDDLLTVIAYHRPGDQLALTVLRDGNQQQVTITLGERPSGGVQ